MGGGCCCCCGGDGIVSPPPPVLYCLFRVLRYGLCFEMERTKVESWLFHIFF